jgi:predicted XRE-type DNA-binding protein
MRSGTNRPAHVTRGDVFDDLFPPGKAAALKVKADLYDAILKCARRYSPRQLQVILEEPQPRISELLHGKIAKVSIEKLLIYAELLGMEPRVLAPQKHRPVHYAELAAGR